MMARLTSLVCAPSPTAAGGPSTSNSIPCLESASDVDSSGNGFADDEDNVLTSSFCSVIVNQKPPWKVLGVETHRVIDQIEC